MAKKKVKALPKYIYVHEVKDGDETYLNASYSLAEAADNDATLLVGTYELLHVGDLKLAPSYVKR